MANDTSLPIPTRIHLTIDGDELVWTIRPRGLTAYGLMCVACGLAALYVFVSLAVTIWQTDTLFLYARLTGTVSVTLAGISILIMTIFAAVRDGWSRATIILDRHKLTVREVALPRIRQRQWTREELKAITAGHHETHDQLLFALKAVGMHREPVLQLETASGPQAVLGGMTVGSELRWVAAILHEHVNTPPEAQPTPPRLPDVLLEVDPHIVESGGRVALPLSGPNGEGWGTVLVTVPPGASDGTRLPLRGLGPGGAEVHVRLKVAEPNEREHALELPRHRTAIWDYHA